MVFSLMNIWTKWIFNELVEDRASEFKNLEKIIHPDNFIYKYKTEEKSLKDFRNYQYPIKLFKKLRDGNVRSVSFRNNWSYCHSITILLTMIINKIQESCIHLFLGNCLVNY